MRVGSHLDPSPPQRSLTGQLARYAAVGAVATLSHFAVLGLMVEGFGQPPGWGSALGALLGAQVAFVGNRWFTFAEPAALWTAWWRFQSTALLGGAIGAALVTATTLSGWHWLPAQGLATGLVLLLTFFVNRYWSFGSSPTHGTASAAHGAHRRSSR